MALVSLGKNAALLASTAPPADLAAGAQPEAVRAAQEDASSKLKKTRGDIQKSLTPWIPGDFLVSYGALLTAWTGLQSNFWGMVIVTAATVIVFVWAGAFSLDEGTNWSKKLAGRLAGRSLIGFVVALVAAATIPKSGWYEFSWFSNNEQSVLTTLGILTGALVLVLTGLKMRGVIDSEG
ncbi:hypothetical protein [Nocardioides taihuensis]|uniref:Uncharacterized protein n=1 Tax=Nocardioides taihuensis TaxID=1835606 RepID=A0ABW0BDT9_9ACTN